MSNERVRDEGMQDDGNGMTTEDRAWSDALPRVAAPEGFTDRVMARIAMGETAGAVSPGASPGTSPAPRRGVLLEFRRPVWRMAYAAAALLAVTAGTLGVQHHRTEKQRVDAAAAQFDEAMQVTGHALDHVSAQLEETKVGAVERALTKSGGK